jgi:phosphatidylglycerol:prolipoprotein diacylglycerol transferase
MPITSIPYPIIDPVLVNIGPFPIRWYALAYLAGLAAGWAYARWICSRDRFWRSGPEAQAGEAWGNDSRRRGLPHPSPASVDDLVVYIAFGIVLGGRLGYVLFYNLPYYLDNPGEIIAVWKGGMAFHGGLAGATLAIWLFARRHAVSVLSGADVVAAGVPVGLFFGRLANFIKPELWGRPTDVPWAMKFPLPLPNGQPCLPPMLCVFTEPRHPSQLYEAGLEGVVLFIVLALIVRYGGLQRPGLVAGCFGIGYGIARIICEFFRQPDPQLGFLFGGATMGMLLSLPVIAIGAMVLAYAYRRAPQPLPGE